MNVRTCLSLAVLTTSALCGVAHADDSSIKVKLWQHGEKGGIDLSQDHVKAGPVEFVVTNTSTDPTAGKMHEFLIAPWSGSTASLPYDPKEAVVKEDAVGSFVGIEDMLPSATATLGVVLKPGEYVVFSNVPHDYKSGMVHRFTVEPPGKKQG